MTAWQSFVDRDLPVPRHLRAARWIGIVGLGVLGAWCLLAALSGLFLGGLGLADNGPNARWGTRALAAMLFVTPLLQAGAVLLLFRYLEAHPLVYPYAALVLALVLIAAAVSENGGLLPLAPVLLLADWLRGAV